MLNFTNPFKKNASTGSDGKETLLQNFSSKSNYAEAFRTFRTNLHFSLMDQELESLLITSAGKGEGKSNTVANLAYTVSQAGKKVLMIDADLRKPGLSKRFAVENRNGLSTLISEVLGKKLTNGKIAQFGLADILKLCSLQRRTCVMDIADLDNEAALFFNKGELVDIYWKNRPEFKKLANALLREKLLTKEEAKLALGHQKQSVRKLGSILLTMGFVKEEDLERILSVNLMEAFRVTTTMVNGSFSFRNLKEEEVDLPNDKHINFEELYSEFLGDEGSNSFIKNSIDKAIIKTRQENLYLLPSGKVPPNPAELIGSERTSYLLDIIKKKFDMVIIDSSPVMPASDALLLAPQVDGAVLVVKAGEVNRKILQDTVQHLKTAKANILGVTLNQADRTQGEYYKYYKAYYGE